MFPGMMRHAGWRRKGTGSIWREEARRQSPDPDPDRTSQYTEDRWRGASATLNASGWRGILATRNVLDTTGRDRAWALPASFLAYLIDT